MSCPNGFKTPVADILAMREALRPLMEYSYMSTRPEPKPGETWKHFKGGEYAIICIAFHSETREKYVVYQSVATNDCCIRPLSMFMDTHPTGPVRFTKVEEPNTPRK